MFDCLCKMKIFGILKQKQKKKSGNQFGKRIRYNVSELQFRNLKFIFILRIVAYHVR